MGISETKFEFGSNKPTVLLKPVAMSNKASDQLHKLIKSLSKPEKRYFKVFSSRHIIGDENNYQTLFDAIDKQEEYDEEKLMKKFKDKSTR